MLRPYSARLFYCSPGARAIKCRSAAALLTTHIAGALSGGHDRGSLGLEIFRTTDTAQKRARGALGGVALVPLSLSAFPHKATDPGPKSEVPNACPNGLCHTWLRWPVAVEARTTLTAASQAPPPRSRSPADQRDRSVDCDKAWTLPRGACKASGPRPANPLLP
jgi:hypothetical protein